MKYSKSILIFLFVSFTISAFYYALSRINGNVGKLLIFTMYVLLIKLNLIRPNVVMRLNEPKENQQFLTETRVPRVSTFYHPHIFASNDYFDLPSPLYMRETKMGALAPHYSRSAITITDLRVVSRYDYVKQTAYFLVS